MPSPASALPAPSASITETDRRFLTLALKLRKDSDDPKARHVMQSGVGAIIVNENDIVAESANVLPPALKANHALEEREITESERYHFIEHAERGAIFKALLSKKDIEGATIYCTRFPCSDCARAIVWSGIRRAVVATGLAGEGRWLESQRAAADILRSAGVTVRILNVEK